MEQLTVGCEKHAGSYNECACMCAINITAGLLSG